MEVPEGKPWGGLTGSLNLEDLGSLVTLVPLSKRAKTGTEVWFLPLGS